MSTALLTMVALQAVTASPPGAGCTAPAATVKFDHVPIVVHDLAAASALISDSLGLSLKPGHPHRNGIENVHVRFADGSGLELISVRDPSDALAEWYAAFLEDGEGGAFLALDAGPIEAAVRTLRPFEIDPIIMRMTSFDWAVFGEDHALHHVFLIDTHSRSPDTAEQLTHRHGESGVRAVWIESDDPPGDDEGMDALRLALIAFGAVQCTDALAGPPALTGHPGGFAGEAWGIADGTVYLVSGSSTEHGVEGRTREPRILAVALAGSRSSSPRLVAGVWIETVNAVNEEGR
jgi:hypothetical protein